MDRRLLAAKGGRVPAESVTLENGRTVRGDHAMLIPLGCYVIDGMLQRDLSKIPRRQGLEIAIGPADPELFGRCSSQGFCLTRIGDRSFTMRLDYPDGVSKAR